jgi:hypothetical protein
MTTDILGMKFNRWTVLASAPTKNHKGKSYSCRCECGTKRVVRKDQLTRGVSKSCGCLKAEVAAAQVKRLFTTHGLANKTRTYGVWKGIRKRCTNPNAKEFKFYGGRGISMCNRWQRYENFLADMGEAPKDHSIDRIDVNGNYEPKNCRWADKKTQMNNMRPNVLIKYMGETLTLKQWAEKLGVPYHRIYQRIFKLSWSVEKAFTAPR